MATPDQIAQQVRYFLSELGAQNAHHSFEDLCRHLVRETICTNVIPATGPVSVGGDQGRDFETFRSFLKEELGPYGAFLGRVSDGPIVFICTLQQDDLPTKIRTDISKVLESPNRPVHIYAMCSAALPAAKRNALVNSTLEEHGLTLDILDGLAIAELLATRKTFWIAERFLSLPADLAPPEWSLRDTAPGWYVKLRETWRNREIEYVNLGDVLEFKDGLRHATFDADAREDLPFWLDVGKKVLASTSGVAAKRAAYELILASVRGTYDLRSVETIASEYFANVPAETEAHQLRDVSIALMMVSIAFVASATNLSRDTICGWHIALKDQVTTLLLEATPTRRAILLFVLGYLGIHPSVERLNPIDRSGQSDPTTWDEIEQQLSEVRAGKESDTEYYADLDGTIKAWGELAESLADTPLFPVEEVTGMVTLLTLELYDYPKWHQLTERMDEAIARVRGKDAAARMARDRSMVLLQAGEYRKALGELHRAKVDWWTGDTLRGAILALLTISDCYLSLRLPQAAKVNALTAAAMASASGQEELADLLVHGLLHASHAEFACGAWCSAAELLEIGLIANAAVVAETENPDKLFDLQRALAEFARIIAVARDSEPALVRPLENALANSGYAEIVNQVIDGKFTPDTSESPSPTKQSEEFIETPFLDAGPIRIIRFCALGLNWTIRSSNDFPLARAAERLAAAAQVLLVELAEEDLCLMPTTIDIEVQARSGPISLAEDNHIATSLPSNKGRRWVVRLQTNPNPSSLDFDTVQIELLTALSVILSQASLLPDAVYGEALTTAFQRGLHHKLAPGRTYDEIAAEIIPFERYIKSGRASVLGPPRQGTPCVPHPQLSWQSVPGPTFSDVKAEELIRNRYEFFDKGLTQTLSRLRAHEPFGEVVRSLRAEGWLDWHLLTAIATIALNFRSQVTEQEFKDPKARERIFNFSRELESSDSIEIPLVLFTEERMRENRIWSMLSLAKIWELESIKSEVSTPDIPAIEKVLAERYGYWSDDREHKDPFPEWH